MFEFGPAVAIKICGVTSIADALLCGAAGADMIGLNFSLQSLRCITPEGGADIVASAREKFPRMKVVGVFVDQEPDFVQTLATDLALDAVQLHGNETVADVVVAGGGDPGGIDRRDLPARPGSAPAATMRRAPFVIKALRIATELPDVSAFARHCGAILLDTWSAQAPGGTGETFPWSVAAGLRPQVSRLILAGGLTSANVAEAIRRVRPFAVDVCSGVETAPGDKDETKVRAFIRAVEELNHEKTAIRA
ncbi:MAG: phosphoribosylanthranilate isomerase [Chthoniobacterales bacterium]|nr:phosphoribosylanthranilate isomerase [Chthoniobacterales bacterium]